ncbi:UDP-glucose/GDP-mannose dehydrogenase [Fulvitalea axinellae]|uniref:UDP-glucose/GDP-mannose dehydrogenase n=1 Tax=Fulvitalea axinellae TaxID=1182444 RepID=A0AAU9CSV5_9BACT|nr:UDP-glucose/GDP-mannose dehydrogenase [Fulvitalea axinellae]
MSKHKIAVIGLGYVGLPLAVEFGRKYPTIGFDINETRVRELNDGHDHTLEVSDEYLRQVIKESGENFSVAFDAVKALELEGADGLAMEAVGGNIPQADDESDNDFGIAFTADTAMLAEANVYIITVPTPVDRNNRPDLTPLYKASETVGKVLREGDIVIYESTVYPGVTEDECVPVLERFSGMKYNEGFYCGYSPERINPGDKEHTVTKIKKVTAGSTPEIGKVVDEIYRSVIVAGTHLAPNIKVAEASKVIENSQRDINIAFVNELAKIFNRMDIDTADVLEAAGTKWNFLPFRPGLVGGHCIGVDPYYLAQKAQETGYHPEIILAGRRLNDGMGAYVASQTVKLMIDKGTAVKGAKVLTLGITFKENCPDIRNTKAIDVINELKDYGADVSVYDPWAEADEVRYEYGLDLLPELNGEKYDAVVLAVAHKEFLDMDIRDLCSPEGVIYDVKNILPKRAVDGRL